MKYTDITNVADIRRTTGISKSLIDDDDVQNTIPRAVKETNQILHTSLIPRIIIEVFTPDYDEADTEEYFLSNTPVLQLNEIKINDTTVSPKYVELDEGSGRLEITSSAEVTKFDIDTPKNNVVKYTYGLLEPGDYETATTSAITTPSSDYSVPVTAGTGTNFNVGDYVRIEGMDGNYEVSEITATAANTITCDIVRPHESASRVILMETPGDVKRLVEVVTGLMLIARQVGASYDDITGYTLGEESVQKGEPYTQWRETHLELVKEYNRLVMANRRITVA